MLNLAFESVTEGLPFYIPQSTVAAEADALKQFELIWVEPGTFHVSTSGNSSGSRDTEVTIKHGYWLAKYPTTQAQWLAEMGYNPSAFTDDPNLPVETVDWSDVLTFCSRLNDHYEPRLPEGYRFALPSQIQWEYACRAGSEHTCGCLGDEDLALCAWYGLNSGGRTHPVGRKRPNRWQFHDMLGNINEWCLDCQAEYPETPVTDWIGTEDCSLRIVRGGAWSEPQAAYVCCTFSSYVDPAVKAPWIGFRLCVRHSLPLDEKTRRS